MPDYEPILRWFAERDLRENLYWGFNTGSIKFYVLCNDMFWWGTADAEDITVEDLPDLQRAYDDLKAADLDDICMWVYAPELWIARKRGMRPQTPWWNREKIPEPVKQLFLAAGPERDPKDEG